MEQFLALTPKQFQFTAKALSDRRHNNRAMQYHLHGFDIEGTDADFIDKEFEAMMKSISEKHHKQEHGALNILDKERTEMQDGKKS